MKSLQLDQSIAVDFKECVPAVVKHSNLLLLNLSKFTLVLETHIYIKRILASDNTKL